MIRSYDIVSFHEWVHYKTSFYAVNIVTNNLIEFDEKTYKVCNIIDLHMEQITESDEPQYFSSIILFGHMIFLFPYFYSGYLVRYDITSESIDYICLKKWMNGKNITLPRSLFFSNGEVYFPPSDLFNPFIIYNIANNDFRGEILFDRSQEYELNETFLNSSMMNVFCSEFWFVCGNSDVLFGINENRKECVTLDSIDKQSLMDASEDYICYVSLWGEKRKLNLLNRKTGIVNSCEINAIVTRWKVVILKNHIMLLSMDVKCPEVIKLYEMDGLKCKDYHIDVKRILDFRQDGFWNYMKHDRFGNKVFLFPEGIDKLVVIDYYTSKVSTYSLKVPIDLLNDMLSEKMRKRIILKEDNGLNLRRFISTISV